MRKSVSIAIKQFISSELIEIIELEKIYGEFMYYSKKYIVEAFFFYKEKVK